MPWRDPRGTPWDPSASRQATRMGLACVALTTTLATYKHTPPPFLTGTACLHWPLPLLLVLDTLK